MRRYCQRGITSESARVRAGSASPLAEPTMLGSTLRVREIFARRFVDRDPVIADRGTSGRFQREARARCGNSDQRSAVAGLWRGRRAIAQGALRRHAVCRHRPERVGRGSATVCPAEGRDREFGLSGAACASSGLTTRRRSMGSLRGSTSTRSMSERVNSIDWDSTRRSA